MYFSASSLVALTTTTRSPVAFFKTELWSCLNLDRLTAIVFGNLVTAAMIPPITCTDSIGNMYMSNLA